jgi:hypothetical protein
MILNIINFQDYVGSATGTAQGWQRNRLTFDAEGWLIRLDGRLDLTDVLADLHETGGFAFTHVAAIERKDGGLFSWSDVRSVWDVLFHVLAFARGALVGLALPTGLNVAHECLWTRWSISVVDPWSSPFSWWDKTRTADLAAVFRQFMACCRDPYWNDVLRRTVRYFIDANNPRPLDRAIIMSQAALDLLSSSVIEERALTTTLTTRTHGKKPTAAHKIRCMADWGGIPTGVPAHLTALAAFAPGEDGPVAITRVRNRLAHPSRTAGTPNWAVLFDAWRLSQWFLELGVLRVIGFEGTYGDRLKEDRWVGDVEPVPWVP